MSSEIRLYVFNMRMSQQSKWRYILPLITNQQVLNQLLLRHFWRMKQRRKYLYLYIMIPNCQIILLNHFRHSIIISPIYYWSNLPRCTLIINILVPWCRARSAVSSHVNLYHLATLTY